MVFCIVELSIAFIVTIITCSPKASERRIRTTLHIFCCCIIRDNDIIDSLVSGIMRQPSFRTFSLSDVIAGLLMANLVYHQKNKLIKSISNPDERLRIRTMRVNEFIEYIRRSRNVSRAFSLRSPALTFDRHGSNTRSFEASPIDFACYLPGRAIDGVRHDGDSCPADELFLR